MRRRRSRRKAVGMRAPILVEVEANARWFVDFVHDQMANGRRFRILNIVDDVMRECLGAIPDTSISGVRVARELTTIIARRGKLAMIVSDHRTEFTSNAMRMRQPKLDHTGKQFIGGCGEPLWAGSRLAMEIQRKAAAFPNCSIKGHRLAAKQSRKNIAQHSGPSDGRKLTQPRRRPSKARNRR